jgi:multidrug efflux system membrane fusion protein
MLINRLLQSIVVLTIGFPTLAMSQDAPNSARPAKVFTVHAADGMFTREYPAIVAPSQQAVVTFQVSGNIIELAVLAGQQIKTGDVIARLDPRNFENAISELDSSIDQAMAQLRALRAGARAQEVSALEAAVEAVQAQVDQASEQAKRSRTLQERGIVAASKVESDEATLRVVQTELCTKLEELYIGKSGGRIEAAEVALRGLHAKKSSKCSE